MPAAAGSRGCSSTGVTGSNQVAGRVTAPCSTSSHQGPSRAAETQEPPINCPAYCDPVLCLPAWPLSPPPLPLQATSYLNKLPAKLSSEDLILITDPMLATGGTMMQVGWAGGVGGVEGVEGDAPALPICCSRPAQVAC